MIDIFLLSVAVFSFLGILYIFFRKSQELSLLKEEEIRHLEEVFRKEKGFFNRNIVNTSLIALHSSEKFLRKLKILTLRFDNFFARQIVRLKSKSAELRHPSDYFKDLHLWKKEIKNQELTKKENPGITLKDIMDIHSASPAAQKYLEELERRKQGEKKPE